MTVKMAVFVTTTLSSPRNMPALAPIILYEKESPDTVSQK